MDPTTWTFSYKCCSIFTLILTHTHTHTRPRKEKSRKSLIFVKEKQFLISEGDSKLKILQIFHFSVQQEVFLFFLYLALK